MPWWELSMAQEEEEEMVAVGAWERSRAREKEVATSQDREGSITFLSKPNDPKAVYPTWLIQTVLFWKSCPLLLQTSADSSALRGESLHRRFKSSRTACKNSARRGDADGRTLWLVGHTIGKTSGVCLSQVLEVISRFGSTLERPLSALPVPLRAEKEQALSLCMWNFSPLSSSLLASCFWFVIIPQVISVRVVHWTVYNHILYD